MNLTIEHSSVSIMDQKLYAKNAAFVPKLSQRLLALAAIQPHEAVLDFGCGDGVLTKILQDAATTGRVVGIDNQEDMIEAARAAGIRDARVISAQELHAHDDLQQAEFDVVLTNAVLHWIPEIGNHQDPYILGSIAKAMKANGRFVGEFGGFSNISEILATIIASLLHHGVSLEAIKQVRPFYFPLDEEWKDTLERAGFRVQHIESEARVTQLPGKVSAWAQTFLERSDKGSQSWQIVLTCVDISCSSERSGKRSSMNWMQLWTSPTKIKKDASMPIIIDFDSWPTLHQHDSLPTERGGCGESNSRDIKSIVLFTQNQHQ